MESKLLLESQIFQNIINTLPLLLFWTDVNNIYMGNNTRHSKAFGFSSPDEINGKPLTYLFQYLNFDDAFITQIVNEHNEVINKKKGKKLEYTAIMADGKKRTWLSYKEPLLNERDVVIG